MAKSHYTFGDTDTAELRLQLFAQVFEASSRGLLERWVPTSPEQALDIGCGPGYTSELVQAVTQAAHVTGLDQSERFITTARARTAENRSLTYATHNVLESPYPAPPAELLFCRALLTHLSTPEVALTNFHRAVKDGGRVVLEEVQGMTSAHPTLQRYYALVAALQAHYGQRLAMGEVLPGLVDEARFTVLHNEAVPLQLPGVAMPRLHVLNIATWKRDPNIGHITSPAELESLEDALAELIESGGVDVTCTLRQLVLKKVGS